MWENHVRAAAVNETITLLQTIEQIDYNPKDIEEWNTDAVEENLDSNDSEDSDCEILTFEEKKSYAFGGSCSLENSDTMGQSKLCRHKKHYYTKKFRRKGCSLKPVAKKSANKNYIFF
ncbi:uncharacterized protein LOC126740988 [Anthonomus grandis grandis]|uniref:uncharacterized protein LOC126740988 n=1 Tax=Anthonomus grandis grandis TaxID=2921223 RepID=UPI002166A7CC|nr:uncharacterized protein LOC126740988 [Anthonomus grandis grandis]